LVAMRPQVRTKRTVPNRSRCHEAVEPADTLLRVNPIQHQMVFDRTSSGTALPKDLSVGGKPHRKDKQDAEQTHGCDAS
jgi:hypothetical protein